MSEQDVDFTTFLRERLGTRNWVLAPRLTESLRRRGYTLAITAAQYKALEIEHEALTGTIAKRMIRGYREKYGLDLFGVLT